MEPQAVHTMQHQNFWMEATGQRQLPWPWLKIPSPENSNGQVLQKINMVQYTKNVYIIWYSLYTYEYCIYTHIITYSKKNRFTNTQIMQIYIYAYEYAVLFCLNIPCSTLWIHSIHTTFSTKTSWGRPLDFLASQVLLSGWGATSTIYNYFDHLGLCRKNQIEYGSRMSWFQSLTFTICFVSSFEIPKLPKPSNLREKKILAQGLRPNRDHQAKMAGSTWLTHADSSSRWSTTKIHMATWVGVYIQPQNPLI